MGCCRYQVSGKDEHPSVVFNRRDHQPRSMPVINSQGNIPAQLPVIFNQVKLSALPYRQNIFTEEGISLTYVGIGSPLPLCPADMVDGVWKYGFITASGLVCKTSAAVICMKMGKDNISNILRLIATSCQSGYKTFPAAEPGIAEELFILFISPASVCHYHSPFGFNYKRPERKPDCIVSVR